MFQNKQNKRIKRLEDQVKKLTEELQGNEAIGDGSWWGFEYAPNRNTRLNEKIEALKVASNQHRAITSALLKYLKLEYIEELGARIRKIKKNK